jgi:hypothetical protein
MEDMDADRDDDTDLDDADPEGTQRRKALAALGVIEDDLEDDSGDDDVPKKGVFAMKFMKEALDKQKKDVKRQLEKAKDEILNGGFRMDHDEDSEDNNGFDPDLFDGVEMDSEEEAAMKKKKKGSKVSQLQSNNPGRRSFGETTSSGINTFEENVHSDEALSTFSRDAVNVKAVGPVAVDFSIANNTTTTSVPALKPIFEVENFQGLYFNCFFFFKN